MVAGKLLDILDMMHAHRRWILASLWMALSITDARAQCSDWSRGFERPGADAPVNAMQVFDDGSGLGPTLFVAGDFSTIGSASIPGIARWNGSTWSAVGVGTTTSINALALFDAGNGTELYASGSFEFIGGVAAKRIAKWNGATWSALGSGIQNGEVLSMAVFDDGLGGGPALYAAGTFNQAGGVFAPVIAKWNGTSWSHLTNDLFNERILTLASYDDGTGAALYAGGWFTNIGGVSISYVAKWNGTSWSAVSGGTNGTVYALAVHDDGTGSQLYAGGSFGIVGGASHIRIARWNGTSWSGVGTATAIQAPILTLLSFDHTPWGGVRTLYVTEHPAAGQNLNRILRWDGVNWQTFLHALGRDSESGPRALALYSPGAGGVPDLYAGGRFFSNDQGVGMSHIAKWNGLNWQALAHGNGVNDTITALSVLAPTVPAGPALYAGGHFVAAGNTAAKCVGRFNGNSWSALGSGFSASAGEHVNALATFPNGTLQVFAGGAFTQAGSVAVENFARFSGTTWSVVGGGLTSSVTSISATASFAVSGSPELYVAGDIVTAGGLPVNNIARWNGSTWSSVGTGTSEPGASLAVYDDGTGAALYVGGNFATAGGITVNGIAKWNGTAWSALGSGLAGPVGFFGAIRMSVYDDGSGSALYIGGQFSSVNGVSANNIAKWNGSNWAAVGSGLNDRAGAMAIYDEGNGPELVIGGDFTQAGGVSANHVAKWNGTHWSTLGSGTDDFVYALATFDDGTGPALYAGGKFRSAGGKISSYIAKWQRCPGPGHALCPGDGLDSQVTTPCPCGASQRGSQGHGCANSQNSNGAILTGSGTSNPDQVSLHVSGMPNQTVVVFLKGSASITSGAPFGDGIRCAGGQLIIFGAQATSSGTAAYPFAFGQSVSGASLTPPGSGQTAYYQALYRNVALSFCPPATFNVSNGYSILW